MRLGLVEPMRDVEKAQRFFHHGGTFKSKAMCGVSVLGLPQKDLSICFDPFEGSEKPYLFH